jgi:hypothetical protein
MTPQAPKYRPFDQSKHLGLPPWGGDALARWEEAHGHDVRLKCYPEFGCQVIGADAYYRGWQAGRSSQVPG